MDNIYDILNRFNAASQPLMEGRGTKPDFLDLDKDGNRTEPMKSAAKEVDEASYSAKAARAGKDIGKPGKAFAQIAKSAGERYGSKERGEKVAGAVLAKLRAKESVAEADGPGQQPFPFDSNKIVQLLSKRLPAEHEPGRFDDPMRLTRGGVRIALLRAFNEGPQEGLRVYRNASYGRMDPGYTRGEASPTRRMVIDAFEETNDFLKRNGIDIRSWDRKQAGLPAESAMAEAEMEEGNDFTGARLAAIRAGKPTFKVDGRVYKVTGDTSDEKVMEKTVWPGTKEYKAKFPDDMRTGEKRRSSTGGEIERTATGVKHTAKPYDDEDEAQVDDGTPKKKGRPKGSKRAIGAKVKGTSKLHSKPAIKEASIETFVTNKGNRYNYVLGDDEMTARIMVDGTEIHLQYDPNMQAFDPQESRAKDPILDKWLKRQQPFGSDEDSMDDFVDRAVGRVSRGPGKGSADQQGISEDYDKDEYDEEGEMAQSQARTIEDAAKELQSILDADENLPEWVQKKISLAMDYIDTARDYLAANRPGDEEMIPERELTKPEMKKREEIVKSMKKNKGDFAKRYGKRGEEVMYATATKQAKKTAEAKNEDLVNEYDDPLEKRIGLNTVNKKPRVGQTDFRNIPAGNYPGTGRPFSDEVRANQPGHLKKSLRAAQGKHGPKAHLPEKVKKDESVEETTVAGSVAPAAEAPKGKKGGMIFGKGVYEGRLEESYKSRLETMLTEGMSINMSVGEDGRKNLSVSATDDDAVKLAQILKLAGMQQPKGYDDACPTCGAGRGMCEHEMVEEADLANSADDTVYADTNYMTQTLAGGLNGPKLQVNPNNPADNPLSMRKLGQHSSSSLNLGSEADNLKEETERRLRDLYQRFEAK